MEEKSTHLADSSDFRLSNVVHYDTIFSQNVSIFLKICYFENLYLQITGKICTWHLLRFSLLLRTPRWQKDPSQDYRQRWVKSQYQFSGLWLAILNAFTKCISNMALLKCLWVKKDMVSRDYHVVKSALFVTNAKFHKAMCDQEYEIFLRYCLSMFDIPLNKRS